MEKRAALPASSLRLCMINMDYHVGLRPPRNDGGMLCLQGDSFIARSAGRGDAIGGEAVRDSAGRNVGLRRRFQPHRMTR